MESDLSTCSVCYIRYDRASHIPKLIPTCGHTLCSSCITSILSKNRECPLDRIAFSAFLKAEEFPTNIAIQQVAEENARRGFGVCEVHKVIKDLVCINERVYLCKECKNHHKGHNIKSVEEVRDEARGKVKELKEILEHIKVREEELDKRLKETEKPMITALKTKFDSIRNILNQKEKELIKDLEHMMDNRKNHIDNKFSLTRELKSKIEAKICDLSTNSLHERFFKTLNSKLPTLTSKAEFESLLGINEEYKKRLESDLQEFDTLLVPIIKELKFSQSLGSIEPAQPIPPIPPIQEKKLPKMEPCKNDNKGLENLLDLDIIGEKVIIKAIDNRKLESYGFPDPIKLKKVKEINIIFDPILAKVSNLEILKNIWLNFKEVRSVTISLSPALDDNMMFEFFSDPFWAAETIKSITLATSDQRTQNTEELLSGYVVKPKESHRSGSLKNKFSDQSLIMFGTNVTPKLKNLLNFDLSLDSTLVSDTGIGIFLDTISKSLRNFRRFSLRLNQTQITDKSIECLSKGFYMSNLEEFELSLQGCQITDASIGPLCEKMMLCFTKVKAFAIDLSYTKVTNNSISSLAKNVISQMPLLESLEILFDDLQITDDSVKEIFNNLTQNSLNLQTLKLSLSKTQTSDESIGCLVWQVLAWTDKLRVFSLDLDSTNVSNKSIQDLSLKLQGMMPEMAHFSLSLQKTQVTAKGIEALVNFLDFGYLPYLKNFDIFLDENPENSVVQGRLYEIPFELLQNK